MDRNLKFSLRRNDPDYREPDYLCVDLNAPRVRQHLGAMLRDTRSTTEQIIHAFVTGDLSSQWVRGLCSVQDAWHRLDSEQCQFVMAFRQLARKSLLTEEINDFPHQFFVDQVRSKYLELEEDYENSVGATSIPIEIKLQLARKARKAVEEFLGSSEPGSIWEIE